MLYPYVIEQGAIGAEFVAWEIYVPRYEARKYSYAYKNGVLGHSLALELQVLLIGDTTVITTICHGLKVK